MRTPAVVLGLIAFLLLCTARARSAAPDDAGFDFFEKKIRPVLIAHCYECHSAKAKKLKGNLRLDTRDAITGTSQGLWPGIEIEHGGSVLAGPTSSPWIDTNSGFLRFFRAGGKKKLVIR